MGFSTLILLSRGLKKSIESLKILYDRVIFHDSENILQKGSPVFTYSVTYIQFGKCPQKRNILEQSWSIFQQGPQFEFEILTMIATISCAMKMLHYEWHFQKMLLLHFCLWDMALIFLSTFQTVIKGNRYCNHCHSALPLLLKNPVA